MNNLKRAGAQQVHYYNISSLALAKRARRGPLTTAPKGCR